jgi:flavin-dependent dehydrogenase
MLAAEAAFGSLREGTSLKSYWETLRSSWIWDELHQARNYRPVCAPIQSLLFFTNIVLFVHLQIGPSTIVSSVLNLYDSFNR